MSQEEFGIIIIRDDGAGPGPPRLLIPTLTASASSSPPLAAPFIATPTPIAGQRLSAAGHVNRWVNNNNWIWGVGTRTHDTATGCFISNNDTGAEVTIWAGFFVYAGVSKFLHGIWGVANVTFFRIYVTDNAGEQKVYDNTVGPTAGTALDFTNIVGGGTTAFTVGNTYKVRLTMGTGATPTVKMDYLAIVTSNALTWPTLATMANSYAATTADFVAISTAENYLYNLASAPSGSNATQGSPGSINGDVYNGGFFMYGRDASTVQSRINVRSQFSPGANPVLTICTAGSDTALDTINLAQDNTTHNDSYALTVANYAPATFYRIRITGSITAGNFVGRVTVGGAIPFSNPPAKFSHLSAVNGVGSIQNIGGSGATMNPAEMLNLHHKVTAGVPVANQTGAGTDTGFQFVAAQQDGTVKNIWVGGGKGYLGDGSYRTHVWRVLNYLTAAGSTGSLISGGVTTSLSDTGGSWGSLDLQNVAGLAYGTDYQLTGIVAAFESLS